MTATCLRILLLDTTEVGTTTNRDYVVGMCTEWNGRGCANQSQGWTRKFHVATWGASRFPLDRLFCYGVGSELRLWSSISPQCEAAPQGASSVCIGGPRGLGGSGRFVQSDQVLSWPTSAKFAQSSTRFGPDSANSGFGPNAACVRPRAPKDNWTGRVIAQCRLFAFERAHPLSARILACRSREVGFAKLSTCNSPLLAPRCDLAMPFIVWYCDSSGGGVGDHSA